jgi:hypothetical protein
MFDDEKHMQEIVSAIAAVKDKDPTDEQLVAILIVCIRPVLLGIGALDRIASSLEQLVKNGVSRT